MKRRPLILSFGILMLAIGAFLFLVGRRTRQPTYEGKTVPQWFREFSFYKPKSFTIQAGNSNLVLHLADSSNLQRKAAGNALQALGTNAAIYLAHEICGRDPAWGRVYRSFWNKLPWSLRKNLSTRPFMHDLIRTEAAQAFSLVKSNAGA